VISGFITHNNLIILNYKATKPTCFTSQAQIRLNYMAIVPLRICELNFAECPDTAEIVLLKICGRKQWSKACIVGRFDKCGGSAIC